MHEEKQETQGEQEIEAWLTLPSCFRLSAPATPPQSAKQWASFLINGSRPFGSTATCPSWGWTRGCSPEPDCMRCC